MLASCTSLLGKKPAAIGLWRKALKISSDLSDHRHVAIWTANLGEDLIGIDAVVARSLLNEAIERFKALKSPRNAAYCRALLERLAD
jgi:hypothetical protein